MIDLVGYAPQQEPPEIAQATTPQHDHIGTDVPRIGNDRVRRVATQNPSLDVRNTSLLGYAAGSLQKASPRVLQFGRRGVKRYRCATEKHHPV